MKVQVVSDLHLELLGAALAGETVIRPAPGADVLVLAGDISVGCDAVERFRDWPVPVVFVSGNHEFYGGQWPSVRAQIRQACAGTSVRFLDDDVIEIGHVRFLGSTFWTDFQVRGHTQAQVMAQAGLRIQDFFRIQALGGLLTPAQLLEEHNRSRTWLKAALEKPFGGRTVVVTHHGPHPMSLHPRFAGSALNGAFVSNASELLLLADLWIHGHTHHSADYRLGRCRVMSNPMGYALNGRDAASVAELRVENALFVDDLVIEI